jgi:uncharacterized iron-regulated membrane protein
MSGERTIWHRWVHHPQQLWLRRAIFQLHLWLGLVFGVYLMFISVTGSVLVYRNELFELATPAPYVTTAAGRPLTDDELLRAAEGAHAGFRASRLTRAENPDHAVEVHFSRGGETMARLFDPRTGEDVGGSPPLGIWMVARLIELHDDLLAGPQGRRVNGVGAIALLVAAVTGLIVWWPGVDRWRRSLTLRPGTGWTRVSRDLHSALGFFSLPFLIVSGVSALYLCLPDGVQGLADWLEPPTDENLGFRYVDSAISWLAYLHFGRINGIGIPCAGPGLCDQATKAVWALLGLAPAVLFVTAAAMWWKRVVRAGRRDDRAG